MLKKLTYFNLTFGVVLFLMQKSNDANWLELIAIFFPILFNWKVLQKLQIGNLSLSKLDYIFGVLGLIFALFIFIGAIIIIVKMGSKNLSAILLGVKDIIFSLAIFSHFILSILTQKKNSILSQPNN